MKKITVEIPTIENLTTRSIVAHKKALAEIMQAIADEMIEAAELNNTSCEIDIEEVTDVKIDGLDMAEIQNELRDIGYMTNYMPRKMLFTVEWDEMSRRRLQDMKNSGVKWKVTTRKDIEKIVRKA